MLRRPKRCDDGGCSDSCSKACHPWPSAWELHVTATLRSPQLGTRAKMMTGRCRERERERVIMVIRLVSSLSSDAPSAGPRYSSSPALQEFPLVPHMKKSKKKKGEKKIKIAQRENKTGKSLVCSMSAPRSSLAAIFHLPPPPPPPPPPFGSTPLPSWAAMVSRHPIFST